MRFRDYNVHETAESVMRALSRLQPYKALRDGHDHEPDQNEYRGLLCTFCGADGFEDRDELEEHIESHPFTKKRNP